MSAAPSPHRRGPGSKSKQLAPVWVDDRRASSVSATAELQAVNTAFATLEQSLQLQILAQQDECARLIAAQDEFRDQLAAALQEREALVLREMKARDETEALATRLADAEALWSAQRAPFESALQATRQQSADAQQALEEARAGVNLLQAEVAAARSREAEWASRNAEQASVIQSLQLETSKSADEAERAKAERAHLDSRILELEHALSAASAHHALTQLGLHEDAERIRSNLSEINLAFELQRSELVAAAQAHRLGMQVLHADLAARDQRIAELQAGLDASSAQAREYGEQLVLAHAAARQAAAAHEARLRGVSEVSESKHRELRELAAEFAVKHDTLRDSLSREAQSREAGAAAEHQRQLDALRSAFATLEAAQRHTVLTLQARLQDAGAREQQLASQLCAGRARLESFIEGHMSAMRELYELHAAERRKWLSQQATGQVVTVDSLLSRLQAEAAACLALREEVVALRQALLAQESQVAEMAEMAEMAKMAQVVELARAAEIATAAQFAQATQAAQVAEIPAPSAQLPAISADALQDAGASASDTADVLRVNHEIALLRDALLAERQDRSALAQQLSALARSGPAAAPALPTEHRDNSATACENVAGSIAMPAALASDLIEEENKTMSEPAPLDDILALYDEEFVQAAYSATLRRAPDPAGLQGYLTRLRGGQPKESIVLALAQSLEGQQFEATRGTAQVLQQRLAMQQGNTVARLLRRLLGLDGARSFNRADAAENRLGVKLSLMAHQLTASERRLAEVSGNLHSLEQGRVQEQDRQNRVQEQHRHSQVQEQQRHTQLLEQQRQAQLQDQQRQSQQLADLLAVLTGQIADSLAQLTQRLNEADQRQARMESAVTQAAKVVEATVGGLQQMQDLVREESRRTRAVVGSGQAAAFNPPPLLPAADAVAERAVDPAAFARVREMLMTKAPGS